MRGPDASGVYDERVPQTCGNSLRIVHVTLRSTLLSLRGSEIVRQPYRDEGANGVLMWNGEAWTIKNREALDGNDTEAVYSILNEAVMQAPKDETLLGSATTVARALSQVAGPYAFVFFDPVRRRLFFGRDFLGRRSLLRRITDLGEIILSSVSDGVSNDGWTEVDADGVYCVDLAHSPTLDGPFSPWGQFAVAHIPYNFAHSADAMSTKIESVGGTI